MTTRSPFTKILIANRGEIALRIIRSARALGYRTVAVYSTVDARAPHVEQADQAVWIGEAQPSRSYLNIEALLKAARATGADAVHPGYGFLAENADFAQACRDAGLVFIGPSPESILAMGNKAGAKKIMMDAGVPCVPGYLGEDQSEQRLAEEAERIGFPIMVKATAGGGGRGMRLVTAPGDFVPLLRSAQSEAQSAFGDSTVILERAIANPRHIEIQVFGDRHGDAIHLGERDCSVQRRHQKLIEEAPSPAVSPELRERMGAIAVAAVKAIRYEGAGTLEFLLDPDGRFYFMEMNTRLQVEHPVTEAVTGLDLVALQLHVASGEPLPLRQQDVRFQGHAIEARLCAEDANKSFLPQSGLMEFWRPAEGIRVEQALHSGAEVSPYYDSMIAKIISHGATREEARRKLLRGVEDTAALGVRTNQAFLARCLSHPVFCNGDATTAFLGDNLDQLLSADEDREERVRALVAVLLFGAAQEGPASRLSHALPIALRFDLNGQKVQVLLTDLGGGRHQATIEERNHQLEIVGIDDNAVRFLCDDVVESAAYFRDGARLWIGYRGESFEVVDTTRAASVRRDAGGAVDGKLRAAMNGRVVAVFQAAGARVERGQPLVTLEAMKMEHVHTSPITGLLKTLHVAVGDQALASRVIAEIEAESAEAPK